MRKGSWGQYNKSVLDNLIERIRLSLVTKHIKGPNVLDLGCGFNASLLKSIEGRLTKGVGVDISVDKSFSSKKIRLIEAEADHKIDLPSEPFDTVVALAVIEHVDDTKTMLNETFRLLKKGGRLLLTTPASQSKPLLELMAELNMISKHEIADHKRYYDKEQLLKELTAAGFKRERIEIKYFELGLNIFVKAIK